MLSRWIRGIVVTLVVTIPLQATHAASPTHVLITNIALINTAVSNHFNRLVLEASVSTNGVSHPELVIVNTQNARVLAHISTTFYGQMPIPPAVDDVRGIAYTFVVSTTATTINGEALLAVDLRSGREKRILQLPQSVGYAGLWVDERTGNLVLLNPTTEPGDSYFDAAVDVVSPAGVLLHRRAILTRQPFSIQPANVLIDDVHGRLIAFGPTDQAIEGSMSVVAFSLADLRPIWAQTLTYRPALRTVDPATGRLWLVAHGGRVTALSTATGSVIGVAHMASRAPAGALAVDAVPYDATLYVSWSSGANTYGIDAADTHVGKRSTMALFLGEKVIGAEAPPYALLGLDTARHALIVADAEQGHRGNIDEYALVVNTRTGRVAEKAHLGTRTDGTWSLTMTTYVSQKVFLVTPIQQNNDITGATTAPALLAVSL